MSILSGSSLMRFFPVWLFEVQGLSWWGPDVDDHQGQHIPVVLSIPRDMLLPAVENVVYRMQCVVREKGGHIERCLVLWCTVI
ncbi:hypothetical protein AVEN_18605-1 [Araneus ventricosus]|uniref:Uncharacterized protein n=1 Tax=Araneus ventricosus TaxID=182803 RepID=A0A4Y2FS83_ARAVE|nr:hypothetical protein AVEN_18605-1 [Araneus ventricosus]